MEIFVQNEITSCIYTIHRREGERERKRAINSVEHDLPGLTGVADLAVNIIARNTRVLGYYGSEVAAELRRIGCCGTR